MLKHLSFVLAYIKYRFNCINKYGIHSPYFFNWPQIILYDCNPYPVYETIKKTRRNLIHSKQTINVTDFGTGTSHTKTKKVSSIAKRAAKPHKYGALLFKMAAFHKPQCMIELGTSLGLSAAYQALARPKASVTTLEGCPQTALIASQTFEQLQIKNIKIITGNFDQTFEQVLTQQPKVDWIFFDGNHTYEATMRYFKQALPYVHAKTVFVFDDINWSTGMKQAWLEIKNHSSVKATVDVFALGIVFFEDAFSKQHFVLKY